MCRRLVGSSLFVSAALVLFVGCGPVTNDSPSEDEKTGEENLYPPGLEVAFKQFNASASAGNYEEASKWVAPPGDRVWVSYGAYVAASKEYESVLDERFGKAEKEEFSVVRWAIAAFLNEYYVLGGEIRDVKDAGDGKFHVSVWTARPDLAAPEKSALYEQKFTAAKAGDRWQIQLARTTWIHGADSRWKKVKREARGGTEVEVYIEQDLRDIQSWPDPIREADPDRAEAEEKRRATWRESKYREVEPISYDSSHLYLVEEAKEWLRLTEIVRAQTKCLRKGDYVTREQAMKACDKAFGFK